MTQDIRKTFGRKVQAARKKRGISQERLAHKVGVHRTYIGFIERGERNPTLTKIKKIAKVLSVSIHDLL